MVAQIQLGGYLLLLAGAASAPIDRKTISSRPKGDLRVKRGSGKDEEEEELARRSKVAVAVAAKTRDRGGKGEGRRDGKGDRKRGGLRSAEDG
ncbi:hypothetical protein P5V15_006135 [Pogonomyrmex californicus]